jgi:YVTN family beta-propeller protein
MNLQNSVIRVGRWFASKNTTLLSAALVILLLATSGIAQAQAPATVATLATVSTGTHPQALAVNPVTKKVYVANYGTNNVSVFDGMSNSVTATVAAGISPTAIAVNVNTNKIYVANFGAGTVTVINGANNATATVSVGANPYALAVNSVTNKIYVANYGAGTVTVIDGASNGTSTITAGGNPDAVAVNPVTNRIYVANYLASTVTVINGATTATTTVATGSRPSALAVNVATNKVYVANYNSNTVTVIDGASNGATSVNADVNPCAIAVDPVSNMVYVANYGGNDITAIDATHGNKTTQIAVGTSPVALAIDPGTDMIYAADNGSGDVAIIDGSTNTAAIEPVGNGPLAIAVNPVLGRFYVANYTSNNVTVIDESVYNTVTISTDKGSGPGGVVANPATNKIYSVDTFGNDVAVIDGATGITTAHVAVGNTPYALDLNPVTNQIYVANQSDNTVSVIDGATLNTTTINVGSGPTAVAVNSLSNKIYVADNYSNDVAIIDGPSAITTIVPVGNAPTALAVNPLTGKIYVANQSDNTVTVIDGATYATSTIGVDFFPSAVAVNSITNKIYVANYDTGTVSIIDGATNAASTVTVGNEPMAIAVNPLTNKIYVADNGDATVSVIDGTTNAATTISIGDGPTAIAVDQATNRIYAANNWDNDVTEIDGATNNTATILVGSGPVAIAVNPATHHVYTADQGSDDVTAIAPNTVQTVPLAVQAQGVTDSQTLGWTPIFATTSASPSFTVSATDNYTPTAPAPTALYYQLDSVQGPWQTATAGSLAGTNPANYSLSLSGLPLGMHILYAYSVYGNEGTSASSSKGTGNSPEISNIAAYTFAVMAANQRPQSITFTAPASVTYGDAPLTLKATATSGLPIAYTVVSGPATVNGAALTVTGAGAVTVEADQAGSGSWSEAPPVVITFTVNPAVLTVTTNNQTATYGDDVTQLNFAPIYLGFKNGDTAAVLAGTPNITTLATWGSGAGVYSIDIDTSGMSANNYTFQSISAKLTINPAVLTVTTDPLTATYGDPVPSTYNIDYLNFQYADTPAVLTGAPIITSAVTSGSPAGIYSIVVKAGTLASPNYTFAFVPATYTINKATLTLQADNQTMTAGGPLPVFTYTATGWVNGDNANVLVGTFRFLTAANSSSPAGSTYPITLSLNGISAANYNLVYGGDATLTVVGPTIVLSTSEVDFGSQETLHSTASQHVTMQNKGTALLTGTVIKVIADPNASADFSSNFIVAASAASNCAAVKANKSCDISVKFDPSSAVDQSAILWIGGQEVLMTGTGVAPTANLTASGAMLFLSPLNIVSDGQDATLTNVGTAPLRVTNINITSQFVQQNDCNPPVTLAIGQSCDITVSFLPTAGSPTLKTGKLNVLVGSPATPVSLAVYGTVVPPTYTITDGSGNPVTGLSFANLAKGSISAPQTVVITNTSYSQSQTEATLKITNVSVSSPFVRTIACSNGSSSFPVILLAHNDSCTISVTFDPTTAGPRAGVLKVSIASPGTSASLQLGGTGVVPITTTPASALSFGKVTRGTSLTKSITVTNPANNPDLTGLAFSVSGNSDFALSSTNPGTCGTILAGDNPAQSCTINLVFSPQAGELKGTIDMGTVTITGSQGPVPQSRIVSITGTAN